MTESIPKKHYQKAVNRARRIHEKKSVAQRLFDEETRQRKRKAHAEQEYELIDPVQERATKRPCESRPMTLVLRDLRAREDARIVYTDILAYVDNNSDATTTHEHYLAMKGYHALWQWQEEVLRFIEAREADDAQIHCRSLMLCLDMGLGKTIISLTYLLLDNQRCCRQTGRRFNGCTLIVCQNALLLENWLDEMRQKWPAGAFQYHVLYSAKNRLISRFYIENCCDFLIVTYATVKAAYRYHHVNTANADVEEEEEEEEEEAPEEEEENERMYKYEILYKTRWKRILADESHVIVNRATLLYRAMMALEADIKWVITGTPIQNSLSDICSSFNFIGIPLGNRLERFLDNGDTNARTQLIDKIRETLDVVMIRLLKHEIPHLTPKPLFMPVKKTIKLIEFETLQEKAIYYLYATYAARKWGSVLKQQDEQRQRATTTSIASVLQLMMQLCLDARIVDGLVLPHGLLTMCAAGEQERFVLKETPFREALFAVPHRALPYAANDHTLEHFAARLDRRTQFSYTSATSLLNMPSEYKIEYHARLDAPPTSDLTHLERDKNAECFVWEPFKESPLFDLNHDENDRARYALLYDHLRANNQDDAALRALAHECADSQAIAMVDHLMARTVRRTQSASKNRHIIRYIREETQADDKVLIFSNSVRWLQTMATDLSENGIASVLVSGETHRDSQERIARYKNPNAGIKVLLLSFKLGNVGINIPEANIIIFADPWWNPNMLEQAENRVQRPGQTKTVYIVYFILNHTIDLYVMNRSYDKKYMTTSLMDKNTASKTQHLTRYAYNLYEYDVHQ